MRERGSDFDGFVVSAAPGLLRMAIALTGERAAAEDLLQEVLERMYVAWPRIDDPLAYARRALANRSANRWRLRARRPEHTVATLPEIAVTDRADEHGARDELVRAVALLPARQRAVVVLRFLADLSETETAQVLGCSTGTVKSQSARALAKLRELIPVPTTARRTP
ncbi:MAG TPA: SigE family RNA polymerase sigma factor [Mycobacteriales bacterium]|nr:SigE family RNA polymerase sigma factor [Mycobacteriales bacterium]HVU62040.1 SigE family RNA polymerase sigma factor [Mycobacteriales bacterium]